MIDISGYSESELIGWMSNNDLNIIQVADEFAPYLMWLKDKKIKSYLELGVAWGGTFYATCLFLKPEKASAVDNLEYGLITPLMNKIDLLEGINISVHFKDADEFMTSAEEKFDLILIDANHDYSHAKRNYENALKIINKGGYIVFHDIVEDLNTKQYYPNGYVSHLWNELKNESTVEFVSKGDRKCGIGIIQVK